MINSLRAKNPIFSAKKGVQNAAKIGGQKAGEPVSNLGAGPSGSRGEPGGLDPSGLFAAFVGVDRERMKNEEFRLILPAVESSN